MEEQSFPWNEVNWVSRARRLLDEDVEDDDDVNVSIVTVPKILSSARIEAYRPQVVSIGPYHCLQPDLRHMERFKLSAAKRVQNRFLRGIKFEDVVYDFVKYELVIRAHYHRYLDVNSDTLAWMMAVDASFLLEFLRILTEEATDHDHHHYKRRKRSSSSSSSVQDYILGDVMMLENQIPLFLLTKIIDAQCSSKVEGENFLSRILIGFLEDISPFVIGTENLISYGNGLSKHPHLLDLLYDLILVSRFESCCIRVAEEGEEISTLEVEEDTSEEVRRRRQGHVVIIETLMKWGKRLVKFLCFKVIANLPIFLVFKHLRFFSDNVEDPDEPPPIERQVEELEIPSVTQLFSAGVKFRPATVVDFDPTTYEFKLPIITLDATTAVVLRNLLIYEFSVVVDDGPSVLTRFTEVMVGIIDDEEDVKILRESGVVVSYMSSDEKVVELWNEMGVLVNNGGRTRRRRRRRMKMSDLLDRIVEELNKHYNGRFTVRVWRLMRKINDGLWTWELGRLLFAVLLLFFVSLHGLCFFLRCGR